MQYLWIPIVILLGVLIVCDRLLEKLIKKEKIFKGSRRYYVFYGVGLILPAVAIIIIFFYPKTDTFWEWTLTSVLSLLMIADVCLMSKGLKQLRYNGIVIPIGTAIMIGIWYLVSILSISDSFIAILGAYMGTIIASTKDVERNKKLIINESIVAVIVGAIIAVNLSNGYITKPLRRVEEQVRLQDLTKGHYEITQYQEARRGIPVKLRVFILDEENMLEKELYYSYVNDEVTLISMEKY